MPVQGHFPIIAQDENKIILLTEFNKTHEHFTHFSNFKILSNLKKSLFIKK